MKRRVGLMIVLMVIGMLFVASKDYQMISGKKNLDVSADTATDTTYLLTTGVRVGKCQGYKTVLGEIILQSALTADDCVGGSDSAVVKLQTTLDGNVYTLDSVLAAAIPCTLSIKIPEAEGDTTLYENLMISCEIMDTCGDTVLTYEYPLRWKLILK